MALPRSRSTDRVTKVSESSRTETASDCLNEPYKRHATAAHRYRTQEVAGSSPASSIHKAPASDTILWDRASSKPLLIYLRATKLWRELGCVQRSNRLTLMSDVMIAVS